MKKQMASPDVWDSEGLSIVFKVRPRANRWKNMILRNSPSAVFTFWLQSNPCSATSRLSDFPHFFQVVVVSGIIGVTAILAFLAQPVINNIVNAFPHAS